MTNDLEDRMERIHTALQGAKSATRSPYRLSKRTSGRDEELRALLLQIHKDAFLASYLTTKQGSRMGFNVLYDPDPTDDSWGKIGYGRGDDPIPPRLGWRASGRKVEYALLDRVSRNPPRVYTLYQGRFYTKMEEEGSDELIDHFWNLNPDNLEHSVKQALNEHR